MPFNRVDRYNHAGGESMGRLGLPEMLVILVIALLIFGPRKLPDLARGLGQAIRGFKDAVREGEDDRATTRSAAGDHTAQPK